MKISVVIPVRNEGPAFPLTLQVFSELQQHLDLEVIIVDDASRQPVEQPPEGMRLVRHNSRQGIARSRNAGAWLATGDLLLHTDGHVFFSVNDLRQLIAAFDEQCYFGARTQLIYDFAQFQQRQTESVDGPDYYGWRWTFEPEMAVVAVRNPPESGPHEVPFVGSACLAIPRKLFERLGGFDEGLVGCGNFEDADLALTAWALGYKVRMLPTVTCYHYSAPQPAWDSHGRSPLDVPRYDGSLYNALRMLQRHLPTSRFEDLTTGIEKRFPASWSSLPVDFVASLTVAKTIQPAWEKQRVRSREWVAQKMLGEIE